KERTGIDLKWDANYSRFLKWQLQQDRLDDYLDSLQQFAQTCDLQTAQAARTAHAALLMCEAVRNNDSKAFVNVARVSLAESRLPQSPQKIALPRQRVELQSRRIDWEIKRQAVRDARPRNPYNPFLTKKEIEGILL